MNWSPTGSRPWPTTTGSPRSRSTTSSRRPRSPRWTSTRSWPGWRSRRPGGASSRTRPSRTSSPASTSPTAWPRLKTVGVIARDEINGIVEIAEPVGVVAGITPVTNPTSTTIFKALLALKTRNPIVFAFHPSAQRCSVEAARIVRDAAVAAGAPEHCVQWIDDAVDRGDQRPDAPPGCRHDPRHRRQRDGAGRVLGRQAGARRRRGQRARLRRPAAPKLRRAVNDVVLSKSFDNGMICASEQAVILRRRDLRRGARRVPHAARPPGQRRGEAAAGGVHLRRRAPTAPTATGPSSTPAVVGRVRRVDRRAGRLHRAARTPRSSWCEVDGGRPARSR